MEVKTVRPDPVFDGTLVLDICSENKKIREALWLQDGQEPRALAIFHHLGMFVDTVLIGPLTVDGIDVRFYNYPYSIRFYDCNVEWIKFINHLKHTLYIRGLTEPVDLEPNESVMLKGKLIW